MRPTDPPDAYSRGGREVQVSYEHPTQISPVYQHPNQTTVLPAPPDAGRRRLRAWWLGLLALLLVAGGSAAYLTIGRSQPNGSLASSTHGPQVATQGSQAASPSTSSKPSASSSASAKPSASAGKPQPEPPVTGTTIPDRTNCAPNPSACGMPDAGNTGVPAGTKLTTVNGSMTITKAGAVVQNKDVHGCINVEAPNVTIRDTKISCTDYYGISSFTSSYKGGGLLIEDVEIDCMDHNSTGVGSYGVTARRLNIHGCENGFDVDSDVTVVDSYIHDLYEGATGHADGVQLSIGINVTVQHNTIFNPNGTSAMISNGSDIENVLVANNLLSGGAYTLYCPSGGSTNYRVIGNRFSKLYGPNGGEYGAMNDCDNVAVRSDNLWDNNLSPVANG
ncbi:MAG TPA: hypothetical protein VKB59_15550 [Micromonosporaceae bacterium]|nr:hypothetical protein [Micromonosporaceae bacterium]